VDTTQYDTFVFKKQKQSGLFGSVWKMNCV